SCPLSRGPKCTSADSRRANACAEPATPQRATRRPTVTACRAADSNGCTLAHTWGTPAYTRVLRVSAQVIVKADFMALARFLPCTFRTAGGAMTAAEPITKLNRPIDGAMDRRIERRRFTWPRLAASVAGAALVLALIHQLVTTSGVRSFAIASELVTIETAEVGTFLDFVPIRGSVTPLDTVYLDAVEGGRVEQVFVEEGVLVEAGDPILELSNTTLQLDVISREAQVSEQLNNLRNTRLAMEQNRLSLKSTLVEI